MPIIYCLLTALHSILPLLLKWRLASVPTPSNGKTYFVKRLDLLVQFPALRYLHSSRCLYAVSVFGVASASWFRELYRLFTPEVSGERLRHTLHMEVSGLEKEGA